MRLGGVRLRVGGVRVRVRVRVRLGVRGVREGQREDGGFHVFCRREC